MEWSGTTVIAGMISVGLLGEIIYCSTVWLMHLFDDEKGVLLEKKETKEISWLPVCLSFGSAAVITVIYRLEGFEYVFSEKRSLRYLCIEAILLSLLAGGLLSAALMDAKSSYVYNYVWWWCLLWTAILLCMPQAVGHMGELPSSGWGTYGKNGMILPGISISQAAAVAGFVVLQQCLFARMYGRADSHAFSVCALASCHFGGTIFWFLIHMLLAVTMLAVVQLWNRNVTRQGRLRTPKPFVPYIIIAFWLEILCMLCVQHRVCG